ncbi:MAG: twin-arginine translocase subunit TatC [Kofleriaceae bacterium]|nr:twin-arginine translocase subunit TatC [Myxococcales bacterium]MCB9561458.1 twin-arginine translocase subunit TatC [Kofleriaceae bacterium]MCB9573513.1 twin-arginine translocase subunit TatC [Kofleriaceae bacterium]
MAAPDRDPPADGAEDGDDGRMPLLAHLRELRDRLRNAAIAFVVGVIACWFFSERIYLWLRAPIDAAWLRHADTLGAVPTMHFKSAVEPFWVYMSIALWAGIFVSSPFVFYQLWRFIAPGLYKRERRVGILFAIFSALCFIAGAAFCYYVVLEELYAYLLGYAGKDLQPTLFMSEYLDFTRNMMLAFGAVFEMPMLIFFLASVGLVTHRSLWRFNRWFAVVAFVVGALLTPPDVLSQTLMAGPMIALYNISILIAWVVTRRRERRAAAERARDGAPPPDDA